MPINLEDKIIFEATKFYKELKNDPYGRYRSWEHCYKQFNDARKTKNPDIDNLSLHLSFYLASWGMYRGSSFLLQQDYKVHKPIIKEILKPKYNPLMSIKCKDLKETANLDLIFELADSINSKYLPIKEKINPNSNTNKLSETLITKILMGTLGCTPAYDKYFKYGIRKTNTAVGAFNENSILQLCNFYESNNSKFENCRKTLKAHGLIYPQMKILDMGFWKIGYTIKPSLISP